MSSDEYPAAAPVSIVNADHQTTIRVSTFRGPMTSASHPEGISNSAYDSANALSTRAICAVVRWSSSVIYGAAAEMQTRSRYVMTAMRKPNQSSVMRARDAERPLVIVSVTPV